MFNFKICAFTHHCFYFRQNFLLLLIFRIKKVNKINVHWNSAQVREQNELIHTLRFKKNSTRVAKSAS